MPSVWRGNEGQHLPSLLLRDKATGKVDRYKLLAHYPHTKS